MELGRTGGISAAEWIFFMVEVIFRAKLEAHQQMFFARQSVVLPASPPSPPAPLSASTFASVYRSARACGYVGQHEIE